MRRSSGGLILLLLSALLASAPASHAWRQNLTRTGIGLRQPYTRNNPIPYLVNSSGAPTGFQEAVRAAAQTWSEQPGTDIAFRFEGTTWRRDEGSDGRSGGMDGSNVVFFNSSGSGMDSGVLAITSFWWNETGARAGHILEFDMEFNGRFSWYTNGRTYDLQTVATHEFGHALGFDEEPRSQYWPSVMNPRYTEAHRNIFPSDLEGLQRVYPGSTPPPANLPPTLTNARVTPTSLPRTGGAVSLSVNASDDVGVTRVTASVSGPGGTPVQVVLSRSSGTARSGTWQGTYQAPANNAAQTASYSVVFTATDGAGASTSSASLPFSVAPRPPTTTVQGWVLDSTTHAPLSGALVSLDGLYRITTAADGSFRLENVPTGNYNLSISKEGYLPLTQRTAVSGSLVEWTLTLVRELVKGTLEGVITDGTTRAPVTGALVRLGTGYAQTTGDDGRYRFTDIAPGDFVLTVERSGYRPFITNVSVVAGNQGRNVSLTRGAVAPAKRDDFNGDGRSDLFWRHASGANALWLLEGPRVMGGGDVTALEDTAWQLVGTGDFNGDGRSDLLWYHTTAGLSAIWLMDGVTPVGGGFLPPQQDLRWRMEGVGDFNGDGRSDVLWRNRVTGENVLWFLDGSGILAAGATYPLSEPGWRVAGVDDFSGDGKADLLWRHDDGRNLLWQMDAIRAMGESVTPTEPAWRVAGTGDLNGDGRADIVWRHQTVGANAVWLMEGPRRAAGTALPTLPDLDWQLEALGDYDGDGRADLLWRHLGQGVNALWLMDGATLTGGDYLPTVPDANWRVGSIRGLPPPTP